MKKIRAKLIIGSSLVCFIFLTVFITTNFESESHASADSSKVVKVSTEKSDQPDWDFEDKLIPMIALALSESGYPGGLEYEVLHDKRIELNILLDPKLYNEMKIQKEIKEVIKILVQEHDYDFDLFQIDFNTYPGNLMGEE